jgi:hypothetical protein
MQRTLEVALTQLDVVEATGNNDGVPAVRYNRGECVPWCAAFALYCNANSMDAKVVRTDKEWWALRAVQAFEDEMRNRGWWFSRMASLKPQANDLIFFGDRGASDASFTGRHMGVIERVETHVSSLNLPSTAWMVIHTVEGNLGNRVQRVVHDLSNPKTSARITGYAHFPASP